MSTIETLAMAIDAKDQITHGHIRRVQAMPSSSPRELGVTSLVDRAVEAAALLHDMGKLAVPEYILNKPGPLTPAEFEKMKLHASVGADILCRRSTFPIQSSPSFDTTTRAGMALATRQAVRGADIPIGARILSVVDCFDALTSDRPYRPGCPILRPSPFFLERRGPMYDPLIVDTFLRVNDQIAPVARVVSDPGVKFDVMVGGIPPPRQQIRTDHATEGAALLPTRCCR